MSEEDATMQAAAKAFFTSPRYAVAGTSSDPSKFGHKIFAWYIQQSLTPTPLNPRTPSIKVQSKTYETAPTPSALPSPTETSLSVITPPPVTRTLLKEAKEAGIRAVWLQPGTFDDEVLALAKELFPGRAVGGFEGLEGADRHEGWCLLVHGEEALEDGGGGGAAGRKGGRGGKL